MLPKVVSIAALLRPPPGSLLHPRRCSRVWMSSMSGDDAPFDRDTLLRRLSSLAKGASKMPTSELREQLTALQRSAAALSPSESEVDAMRVSDLRDALNARGLSSTGLKAALRDRLLKAVRKSATKKGDSSVASAAQALSGGALSASMERKLAELVKDGGGKGPQTGIFTDGSCDPNPGPGGWGAVCVRNGKVEWRAHGSEKQTTNNRMELSAIIAVLERLPASSSAQIYSDSSLCVKTLNEWAEGWESRGWKRAKGEPVMNEDLVRTAYALVKRRPNVRITWLRAHAGTTWNEYADRLAGAWRTARRSSRR